MKSKYYKEHSYRCNNFSLFKSFLRRLRSSFMHLLVGLMHIGVYTININSLDYNQGTALKANNDESSIV